MKSEVSISKSRKLLKCLSSLARRMPSHSPKSLFRNMLVLCVIFMAYVAYGLASDDIILDQGARLDAPVPISQFYWFEDKDRSVNEKDVLDGAFDERFVLHQGETLNLGYRDSRVWVKFDLSNDSMLERRLLIAQSYAQIQEIGVAIRLFDQSSKLVDRKSYQTGKGRPFYSRPVPHHGFMFPLAIPAGGKASVLMSFATTGSLQIPLSVMSQSGFVESLETEYLLFGMYYGFVTLLLINSCFLFFVLKQRDYLFYGLYVFSLVLAQLSLHGFSYQFFWPNSPYWNSFSTIFFVGMTFSALSLFTMVFLDTKRTMPWLHRVIVVYGALGFAITLCSPFFYGTTLIRSTGVMTALFPLVMLPVAITAIVRKVFVSWFYFFAVVSYTLGVAAYGIKDMGILANSFVTENGIILGSLIEVALFSLGLKVRLNNIKREQSKVLSQSREDHARIDCARYIAHDLKTPIAAFERILHSDRSTFEQEKHNLSKALSKLHLMLDSIKNNRLDDIVRTKHTSLSVKDIVQQLAPEAVKKGLVLDVRGPDIADILVDAEKLERAILNLLSNAIVAARSKIEVSWWVEHHSLFLFVADDGPGVPKEVCQSMFLPGITFGKAGGTGLGLSYASKVVKGHGGILSYKRIDDLSKFLIHLPHVVPKEVDALTSPAHGSSSSKKSMLEQKGALATFSCEKRLHTYRSLLGEEFPDVEWHLAHEKPAKPLESYRLRFVDHLEKVVSAKSVQNQQIVYVDPDKPVQSVSMRIKKILTYMAGQQTSNV